MSSEFGIETHPQPGTSLGSSDPALAPAVIEEGFAQVRHVANTLRLRKAFMVGAFVWPSFLAADFAIAELIAPGPLLPLIALRLSVWALILLGLVRLRAAVMPTRRTLRLIETGLGCVIMASLGAMATFASGLIWPFCAGAMLLVMSRSSCVAEPWRMGMLSNLAMFASFSSTLGLAFGVKTEAAFGGPEMLGTLALGLMHVMAAVMFSIVASNVADELRRDVYEARTVGRYRLKHRIGVGGMGEVWAAYHGELRRDVALKVLKPAGGQNLRSVERFRREVEATSQLKHPNIIRIFDFGVTDDGIWYYAMELLEGRNLFDAVERAGTLAQERAAHIILQAARALSEAHSAGIHHRDVKPENIFLTHRGRVGDFVQVLDFGIAQVTRDAQGEHLTATGAIIGSPHYLSPEAARGAPVDARSDVYALGAVLHFTLTGKAPFEAPHLMGLLMAHMQKAPPRLAELAPGPIDPELQEIVDRAMDKDPDARYRDAGEFAEALQVFALRHPHQAPRVDPAGATLESSPPFANREDRDRIDESGVQPGSEALKSSKRSPA